MDKKPQRPRDASRDESKSSANRVAGVSVMSVAPIDRVLTAFETAGCSPHRQGKGWRVACPVCGTRSHKGSINIAPNSSVWLNFFCGHAKHEALAVVGLTLADLFPHRDLRSLTREERATFREQLLQARWRAALPVLCEEAGVLLIASNQLGDGQPLNDKDRQRVRLAALRVFDAAEVLRHE